MTFPVVEFVTIMVIFTIGAISPGPDFAMILRQSITHGRKTALLTSAGIAVAILVHGSYTLLGIGLIVSQSLFLFSMLKLIGAAYLGWLGIRALLAPPPIAPDDFLSLERVLPSASGAFAIGFFTNLFNPKAVLFFLSLFTTVVSANTLLEYRAFYVATMSVTLFVWFALVSIFFTTARVRTGFYRMGNWFNRITGLALIFLAIRVALSRQE